MKNFIFSCLLFSNLFFLFSCEFLIHRRQSPKPIQKINFTNKITNINPSGKLQFIVLGDWGEKGNFFQKQVAVSMNEFMLKEKVDFIITAGDNFYQDGVSDVNDSHFKSSFEDIYPFAQSIPWFITLGNHDYMGDIQSLLNYSEKNSSWKIPNSYYSFEVLSKKKVLFLISDTNEFVRMLGFSYRSYMNEESRIAQIKWINENLKGNDHLWKIVIGHHPIYSAGEHGDTKSLQGKFLETLEANQVDFYISGHEHDLQYLKNPNKKLHFLISGAGSKLREIHSSPYSIFAATEPGFLVITLKENIATIRFLNEKGKEIFYKTFEK